MQLSLIGTFYKGLDFEQEVKPQIEAAFRLPTVINATAYQPEQQDTQSLAELKDADRKTFLCAIEFQDKFTEQDFEAVIIAKESFAGDIAFDGASLDNLKWAKDLDASTLPADATLVIGGRVNRDEKSQLQARVKRPDSKPDAWVYPIPGTPLAPYSDLDKKTTLDLWPKLKD